MKRTSTIPDVIDHHLQVLFCGINPGLRSAATGHHFARPGNRFWKALRFSGFTPELLTPDKQQQLLYYKLGITNFVSRSSAAAHEVSSTEFVAGTKSLIKKVKHYTPEWLAVLGIDAFKVGFGLREARLGKQDFTIGSTQIWLLPNPSGLNAHYSLDDFVMLFKQLRAATLSSAAATPTPATATPTGRAPR